MVAILGCPGPHIFLRTRNCIMVAATHSRLSEQRSLEPFHTSSILQMTPNSEFILIDPQHPTPVNRVIWNDFARDVETVAIGDSCTRAAACAGYWMHTDVNILFGKQQFIGFLLPSKTFVSGSSTRFFSRRN
jgi:hypothetical protein